MIKMILPLLLLLTLSACQDTPTDASSQEPIVRGLKTVLIEKQEQSTIRRFPSVLQPAEVSTLSFETPGRLGPMDLKVGQAITKGEVLAKLDPKTLEIAVDTAKSAVAQAQSTASNAKAAFDRQAELLKKKVTTKANVDNARANMETSAAQVAQANKQLENAQENLTKTDLVAPFDGVINTVEVESFANVGVGTPVATIYRSDGFEASFSVSYDVNQQLAVGKPVSIRLADNPNVTIPGIVNELGSRADTVSSFPLVVKLTEVRPELKAGMAIEVAIEFPVPSGNGFLLPLTVMPLKGSIDPEAGPNRPANAFVYVYDDATGSVKTRSVTIGGVRENQLIVINGLVAGERVASAGVSFLRDGQKVKLLADSQ